MGGFAAVEEVALARAVSDAPDQEPKAAQVTGKRKPLFGGGRVRKPERRASTASTACECVFARKCGV